MDIPGGHCRWSLNRAMKITTTAEDSVAVERSDGNRPRPSPTWAAYARLSQKIIVRGQRGVK
jgi:hypothetical protein